MQEHLAIIKEDRAPHNFVVMCQKVYLRERETYVNNLDTFTISRKSEKEILERHKQFHLETGQVANDRLCYVYGIWKLAKKSLQWISGVWKTEDEKESPKEEDGNKKSTSKDKKPQGSIAGAGIELVGILQAERTERKSKRCWFIQSVEEIAQPLRLEASKIAAAKETALTKDVVAMYPNLEQPKLLEGVSKAIKKAWEWKTKNLGSNPPKDSEGKGQLKISSQGWVWIDPKHKPSTMVWDQEEVIDLVKFVVHNSYLKRGQTIYHRKKGFGMGLPCPPQLANLACYTVEATFAETCELEGSGTQLPLHR